MSKFGEEVNIQNQKKNATKLGEECQNKQVVQINACILFKIEKKKSTGSATFLFVINACILFEKIVQVCLDSSIILFSCKSCGRVDVTILSSEVETVGLVEKENTHHDEIFEE